jgi:precorrin-6A/cobalt-precorrin-6A reductase
MAIRHLLILGGTTEARLLAAGLAARPDLRITLSLAGRTKAPLPLAGAIRSGGFGGADGLAGFLRDERIAVLIDATHPFAEQISRNAAAAAAQAGVPLVVLQRPPWEAVAGDRWIRVASVAEAAERLGEAPRRVFLGIGRQQVAPFAARPQHFYLIRSVDPVDPATAPPRAAFILARGPFAEADERRLLAEHRIDAVVSRNSGGDAAYGKIAAAHALGLPVVMIRRPAAETAHSVGTVEAAVALIDHLAPRGA